MGVESIRDIPDDFELSEIQRRACTSVQTGEPWFSAELDEELSGLKYPLYFMDFETVNPAIPRFPGMRPYDQLPFQWSVHVQREPGAEPEHHRVSRHRCERSTARVHHFAMRCPGREWKHRRVSPAVRVAEAFGACGVAARVRGTHQENPAPSVGLASRRSEPRLPSRVSLGRTR